MEITQPDRPPFRHGNGPPLQGTGTGTARKPNGFTLFELLVAMALCMGMISVGLGMYVAALKNTAVNQSQISANASARLVMDYLDKDLKQGIVVPCYPGSPGCNADGTVTIATPLSAAGTYTPTGDVLIVQMPAWNAALSETINGEYDTVIYQYVREQTDALGGVHQCYNLRRIVSPSLNSSRIAEDRWLLPYDPDRDALDATIRRSEPSLEYTPGETVLFRYHVQKKDASGDPIGGTEERTTQPFRDVVMVETRIMVNKTHDDSTLKASAVSRSRLRNWIPITP